MQVAEQFIVWATRSAISLTMAVATVLTRHFITPLLSKVDTELQPLSREIKRVNDWIKTEKRMVWSYRYEIMGLIVGSIALLWYLFFQSMAIYLIFYNTVLTTPSHDALEHPLHFVFPDHDAVHLPYANDSFDAEVTKYQGYQMKISFSLPESPPNYDVGMFMVRAFLLYESNNKSICDPRTAAKSERHGLLRWKTPFQRYLYTLFYWLPLVAGVDTVEEKQTMEIVLFDEFVYNPPEGYYLAINIELSNPNIQIYSSTLSLHAQLHGLSYLCYYYFYTCFLIGSLFIFFTSLFLVAVLVAAVGMLRYKQYTNLRGIRGAGGLPSGIPSKTLRRTRVPLEEDEDEDEDEDEEEVEVVLNEKAGSTTAISGGGGAGGAGGAGRSDKGKEREV